MKSIIALYTATGNSLYVAKRIKDGEIHFIESFLDGSYTLPEDTERLGIIFPVYCWGVPYPVRRFIRECLGERDNSELKYVYAIATYGAFPLYTLHDLSQELGNIGVALSYGAAIKLPNAYVPLQKRAVSEEEARKAADSAQSSIEKAAEEIEREEIYVPRRGFGWRFARMMSKASTKPRKSELSVSESCIGCGVCKSICPMGNISIENGKAVIGSECISCFACYHKCPENAIKYKGAEGQYKGFAEAKELAKR